MVGYFGYETIRYIEKKLKNINNKDILKTPDILLMLSKDLIVFDNLKSTISIITHINPQIQSFEDGIEIIQNIKHKIQTTIIKQNANNNTDVSDFISNVGQENYEKSVNK